MTHVLHVVGSLNRGGAETWIIQVLREARSPGVQFDFLVHSDGPFHYQAEAEALGARVIVCKGLHIAPLYAFNLMRILKTYGPYDVIHSHMHHFSGIPLMIAAAAGVPVRVVQSHLDTLHIDANARTLRRVYTAMMTWLIWKYATVGIAVSQRAADALFPPDWREHVKWRVMLLGIDSKQFQGPADGEALRGELGIPANVKVVGHVGRFEEQKNHTFLLRIAAEYLIRDPETTFLLVGDGSLKQDIESEARELGIAGKVCFAGVRRDVPALMRGVMDTLVMPSLYEGLPLVLLEAQAAGLPCLLSDNIAEETDRAPSLMHRESLASSAETWANRLRPLIALQAAARSPGCPDLVGIEQSIKGLMECYAIRDSTQKCAVLYQQGL